MRALALVVMLGGCGGPDGLVEISAWAEAAAVEGYPASRTDGWDIALHGFVSAIDRVQLSDTAREQPVATAGGPWVVDWTRWPQPAALGELTVRADRYRVGFDFVVPAAAHVVVGEVDADLVAAMAQAGWAHHLSGEATDGERTIRFAWGFDNPTRSTECANGADGTAGVAVPPDGRARLRITLHADHAFWNTLRTEESPIAFAGIAAADTDGDGEVTVDELKAASAIALGYETAGVNLESLYDFLRYSLARAGHLNGGGLCRVQAL
jgi:hypothetical protein